ncbi:MAG: AarF/UbiB family protein [Spirochaetota bacterium]
MKKRYRLYRIGWIFFKIFLDLRREFKLSKKKGFSFASRKMEKIHKKRAAELFDTAVSMGGGLIKLCQYFSTRRDIFPDPYIKVLSNLQDKVPPVPFSEIKKILEEEYGGLNFPFTQVDENPVASASIGQVHRAELRNGAIVALKIQKPGIEDIFDTDFAILFYVFKLISHFNFFKENKDFHKVLDEFVRVTGDELNFEREIFIAKRFKKELSKFSYITVPTVIEQFCTKKIIVMEYIKGDKITEKENWIARNNDPRVIAKRIVEIYIEQFIFFRLIHFDPHPGNILILDNNKIALLDFGMAGEITDTMSKGIKDGIEAFLKRDYEKILLVLKKLGFIRQEADEKKLLPLTRYFMDEIISVVKFDRESMQKINISPILKELTEVIYSHPFQLPWEWAYILKTTGTLVGIVSMLNPDFNIYDELTPHFNRIVRHSLSEIIERFYESAKSAFRSIVRI